MIVNNSSADHGGGMSFDDTVRPNVVNNTVAHNDSTATGSGCLRRSVHGEQPDRPALPGRGGDRRPDHLDSAGRRHRQLRAQHPAARRADRHRHPTAPPTPTRLALLELPEPRAHGNIVWQNRRFFWDATANNNLGGLVLASAATASGPPLPGGYWDFAVYDARGGATLSPTYSSLTNGIGATPTAPT